MGNGFTKDNMNVYFRARKSAAEYDERLYSRAGASELIGVSESSLADYELGNTKVVPVDKVVLMSELYRCPELKTGYCKHECPIGRSMPIATEQAGIEGATLRLIKQLDPKRLKEIKNNLVNIAEDGVIDETEKPALREILDNLDELSLVISELRLIGEKALKG